MLMMPTGRYDEYQRKVMVTSSGTLKDGDTCLILPQHDYFTAQFRLIQIIAEEHEGDMEKAIEEFLCSHAESFNTFWRKNPDKRKQLTDFYIQDLAEKGAYNHR